MTRRLTVILLLPVVLYYLLVALAPHWLQGDVAGWPRSIVLGLLLFVHFVAVTLRYVSRPRANHDKERAHD